jgi:hypothetical protein
VSAELSPEARVFVDAARVARLATTTPEGRLHVVPICPALDGDRILISTEPTQKVRNSRPTGMSGSRSTSTTRTGRSCAASGERPRHDPSRRARLGPRT